MLDSAILTASARARQKLLEGATKVAVKHRVDDWIQCRVAVTEPEDNGEHWFRDLKSGQQ